MEATEALKAKIKNLAKAAAVQVKNERVPSGRLTVKGDPAKLDCAGVDLKALKGERIGVPELEGNIKITGGSK